MILSVYCKPLERTCFFGVIELYATYANIWNLDERIITNGTYDRLFETTWGDDHAKISDDGELLTLSLDKRSGSGFHSKNEYMFGKIDMQLKLVEGNSAGTVTAYYVKIP